MSNQVEGSICGASELKKTTALEGILNTLQGNLTALRRTKERASEVLYRLRGAIPENACDDNAKCIAPEQAIVVEIQRVNQETSYEITNINQLISELEEYV